MFLARAFSHAGSRTEQGDLAEFAHLLEEFFEAALIGDGLGEKAGLGLRESHGGSLRFNFSSQAPGVGLFVHQAALSDPT